MFRPGVQMIITRRQYMTAATAALWVPSALIAADGPVKMRDLYNKDLSFSDLALSLEGQQITVSGFMAPPLRADADFFVLTKMPMSTCPFCETEAEWPDDIMAVYTKRRFRVVPFNVGITAAGFLELGPVTDPDTGFVSRVRLTGARLA